MKRSLYSRAVVCTLQACNFTLIYSITDILLRISELSQSLIFRTIFICVEESNYMKDYMKVRCEAKGKGQLLAILQNRTVYYNTFLSWDQVYLDWTLPLAEVPPRCPKRRYRIWHFIFSRNPGNKFLKENIMNITFFHVNFFCLAKNFLHMSTLFSLKYRTLLVHSLHCLCIDDFMKVFWNSCTKNQVRIQKSMKWSSLLLLLHELHSYRTQSSTTDKFLEDLGKERMF